MRNRTIFMGAVLFLIFTLSIIAQVPKSYAVTPLLGCGKDGTPTIVGGQYQYQHMSWVAQASGSVTDFYVYANTVFKAAAYTGDPYAGTATYITGSSTGELSGSGWTHISNMSFTVTAGITYSLVAIQGGPTGNLYRNAGTTCVGDAGYVDLGYKSSDLAGYTAFPQATLTSFTGGNTEDRKMYVISNVNNFYLTVTGITPAYVQSKHYWASTTNPFTFSLTSPPTSGNTLFLTSLEGGATVSFYHISSISESGVTWTKATSLGTYYGAQYIENEIWYSLSISAGASASITVALTGAVTAGTDVWVSEFTNVNNGKDVTAYNYGVQSGAGVIADDSGTTGTTTVANEVWVSSLGYLTNGNPIACFSLTPTSSFTSLGQGHCTSPYTNNELAYKIVTTTGTAHTADNFDPSGGTDTAWSGLIAAFKGYNTVGSTTSTITVTPGTSGANLVTAIDNGTWSGGAITLSCISGLPTGASCSFNPSSGTPTFTSINTVSASTSTVSGTFTITVQGTNGVTTHTITFLLVVGPKNTPDWIVQTASVTATTMISTTITQTSVTLTNAGTTSVQINLWQFLLFVGGPALVFAFIGLIASRTEEGTLIGLGIGTGIGIIIGIVAGIVQQWVMIPVIIGLAAIIVWKARG